MPATISSPLSLPVEPETRRALWTREALHHAGSLGFLDPERYELLDGDLIEKVKNLPHTFVLTALLEWAAANFPRHWQSEAPIDVAPGENETNAPEPDLTVVSRLLRELNGFPSPEDILLVVEVADSTLRRDLGAKAHRYARAGIVEYWVVDVEGQRVVVYRQPGGSEWGSIDSFDITLTIAPQSALNATLVLSELFETFG